MSTTVLYLVCPPAAADERIAELCELFTVTEVRGPFPAPDTSHMYPVPIPGRRCLPEPGEQDAAGPVCYRLEVRR